MLGLSMKMKSRILKKTAAALCALTVACTFSMVRKAQAAAYPPDVNTEEGLVATTSPEADAVGQAVLKAGGITEPLRFS